MSTILCGPWTARDRRAWCRTRQTLTRCLPQHDTDWPASWPTLRPSLLSAVPLSTATVASLVWPVQGRSHGEWTTATPWSAYEIHKTTSSSRAVCLQVPAVPTWLWPPLWLPDWTDWTGSLIVPRPWTWTKPERCPRPWPKPWTPWKRTSSCAVCWETASWAATPDPRGSTRFRRTRGPAWRVKKRKWTLRGRCTWKTSDLRTGCCSVISAYQGRPYDPGAAEKSYSAFLSICFFLLLLSFDSVFVVVVVAVIVLSTLNSLLLHLCALAFWYQSSIACIKWLLGNTARCVF